jgi:hypothetical protein
MFKILNLNQEPRYGGVVTVSTNGVVGITSRPLVMLLGEGKISGAARVCLWLGRIFTWLL